MKTAAQWKTFYAAERAALGELGLGERLERAPEVPLPEHGALVFPHTMLAATGHLTASVANAVVRSGAAEVLALGVLHGGREEDAELVRSARAGDVDSQTKVRRVFQGEGDVSDPLCAEEFSLDGFAALLALAAGRAGRKPPRIHARYPFLVGDDPASVPGVDELARLRETMPVVATTDPIHHGAGYGTPEGKRLAEGDLATLAWARACIASQLALLGHGDWTRFARLAADVRSDFRDVGPVLGQLLRAQTQHGEQGEPQGEILELTLVDYAEVLAAESPTWVAGPLMRMG